MHFNLVNPECLNISLKKMNKLSLEESLKILSPSESTGSIKKSPRRAKRRVKTPSRSPVRIPKISPTKKYSADEKIISIDPLDYK